MSVDKAGWLPQCPKCLSNDTHEVANMGASLYIGCLDCGKKEIVRNQAIRGVVHHEELQLGSFACNWVHGEIER